MRSSSIKTAIFNTKEYEQEAFAQANRSASHQLEFIEPRLTETTAPLAAGFSAVCAFVNDDLGEPVLHKLAQGGTRLIAVRSAGFNQVDLPTAQTLGLTVVRAPAYSPYAVAEHTVGLMLALNRKIQRAYQRVREGNFALGGLMGFDFNSRTAGIIGTGKIGRIVARILNGYGINLLAYDIFENEECKKLGAQYVSLTELFSQSDIITLHCPLTP